ncbi:MAG: OmpA family protein [Bacteroidota bacterium]|nr:OmpA family protein [Bacteroidota bacterium]
MASKKNVFLSGIICLLASASFAQVQTGYDVKDSSLIPASRQPQHNEFLNNAYPFPAKPRNQWEIGVKGGVSSVAGDVRSIFPTGGFGLHVRKALGYIFSLRAEYTWNRARGLNFSSSNGYSRNPAWLSAGYNPATDKVFYNYKTTVQDLSLQGVVTLNNVRFHKAKTGFNIYAFGGIGGTIYDTWINAKDAAGNPYKTLFNNTASATYSNRKDVKKVLKAGMDKSYETHAETDPLQPKLFGKSFKPSFQIGVGMAFKLSNKFNLAIEERFTSIKTDLLDGQQWQENTYLPGGLGVPAMTRDFDSYNFFSVGLNYNIGKKSVEPLWWANPLDYAYNEINAPRHMKLPKPVLDDADGDGVTDQFDHEPNTPAGAPVDSHGVSKDTDGDGVPDIKDKELITPTQCQPVDADGVGKCPPPACCDELRKYIDSVGVRGKGCGIGDLPSVSFTGRTVALSKDAKAVLASVAEKMRNNPNCKVAVVGYGESSKAAQQLSWDRVNAVIKYLVEKEGVSEDRFIFKFGEKEGDENTVDLRDGTGEEGPNTVPAPHPNLRKKK